MSVNGRTFTPIVIVTNYKYKLLYNRLNMVIIANWPNVHKLIMITCTD